MQTKSANGGAILNALSKIEEINKKPTYSGGGAGFLTAADSMIGTFTGGTSERGRNTQELEAQAQELLGPMLKQYGYNPSNIDMTQALKRLPDIHKDPRVRQEVLQNLRSGVEAEMAVDQEVYKRLQEAEAKQINVQPAQIKNQVWMEYNQYKAKERQGKTNPTQPGSASALPGAARKAAETPEGGGGVREFLRDVDRNAEQLFNAPGKSQFWEAAKDTYGNLWEGAKQITPFVPVDREAAMKEVSRQEERAKTDPIYAQSKIFHGIVNPTALIGGTATSIPKVAAAAAAQGALAPAESYSAQMVNALKSGTVGAVTAGVGKALPTTGPAKGIAGGQTDDVLAKFPSFKPTSTQLNPSPFESSVARGFGVNEAAALEQTKAITNDLMKKAGIEGTEGLTRQNIEAAHKAIGKEFDKLLPKNINVKVASTDVANLQQAIKNSATVQDDMAKAPTLAAVHNALSSGNPGTISARSLHDAWKEVGQTGMSARNAAEIRSVLEGLIEKAIPGKNIGAFKELNQKFGTLKDVERVWRGGGSIGTGEAAGYLNPAKIVTEAGSGPVTGIMEDAAYLVQRFGVRNFREGKVDPSVLDKVGSAVNLVGQGMNKLDATRVLNTVRASDSTKKMIELLRAGVIRAPQNVYDPEASNAPPPGAQ